MLNFRFVLILDFLPYLSHSVVFSTCSSCLARQHFVLVLIPLVCCFCWCRNYSCFQLKLNQKSATCAISIRRSASVRCGQQQIVSFVLSAGLLKTNLQPKPIKWHWTFVFSYLNSRTGTLSPLFAHELVFNCNVILDGLETKYDLIRHLHLKWLAFFTISFCSSLFGHFSLLCITIATRCCILRSLSACIPVRRNHF